MSDYRTTTGEPLPTSRRDQRRVRRRWVIRGAWILAAVAAIGFAIPMRVRIAASGYVTTDQYAEVRPPVAGRVARIEVRSGTRVDSGALLVQLEDSIEQASLQEALNAVRRAEAQLIRREAELAQEERERGHRMQQAELRLQHATATLGMTEELHAQGLASGRALEDQRLSRTLAQADLENLQAADRTLTAKELAVLREEHAMQQSTAERMQAQLRARQVTAPIEGEVVRYPFSVGELVTPNTVLYEVFGGEHLVLKLRIPERHATRVFDGAAYTARLSTHPGWGGVRFTGIVEQLRTVIQSDGRESYRMAYCAFDAGDAFVPPGASAEARITIARVPFWFWLFGMR